MDGADDNMPSPRLWLPGGLRSPFNDGGSAALDAALEAAATTAGVASSDDVRLDASWTACYEFPEQEAYDAMVQDEERALLYEQALQRRIKGHEGSLIVLDIGTGPYAILAILAARAGAQHVYAIEANPKAAKSARTCVASAGGVSPNTITVIEGLSTDLTLPVKADLLVAEIVGSVASEEGLITTMRDAQKRHLKNPYDASSYIPVSVATLAAPAAYALHHVLAPPAFDWYAGLKGQPVRCGTSKTDSALQLLAKPQVIEQIAFHRPLPEKGRWEAMPALTPISFELCGECIARSEACYADVLAKERVPLDRATPLAFAMARSLTGFALWPRLELDEESDLCIDARAMSDSHWQTVLPLLAPRPMRVAVGDKLRSVSLTVELPGAVDEPIAYSLCGVLERTRCRIQPSELAARNGSGTWVGTALTSLTKNDSDGGQIDSDDKDDDGMIYSEPFPPSPTGRRLRPVVVPL